MELTDKQRATLLLCAMHTMMDVYDVATPHTRKLFKSIPMQTMKDAIASAMASPTIDQNDLADLMRALYESLPQAVPADTTIN